MSPYTRAAACLMLLAILAVLFIPFPQSTASADDGLVMIPEGGRLEAIDAEGRLLGPVPLQHTDVRIAVSGPFARVALRQTYRNPYQVPIEAIYTFPMSHRAAVDRMTMTIGDRVIEGEVRERDAARRLYESARHQGHVAALLEQERPNIFTQSVANIEPGATIEIDIAYIEMVSSRDGTNEIAFPMTVAPRYVPGSPSGPAPPWFGDHPRRQAITLRGPAEIAVVDDRGMPIAAGDDIQARLAHAVATDAPVDLQALAEPAEPLAQVAPLTRFRADYADGSFEFGTVDTAGRGEIGGRWFRCPPMDGPLPELPQPLPPRPRPGAPTPAPGGGFSGPTDQVPDAHLVTPTPVRPPARAGHDISIEVTVDTGGPALVELQSAVHEVTRVDDGDGRARLTLARQQEIPNRDFVLRWRTDAETITEGVFTHFDKDHGGFVTIIVAPPARVTPDAVPPRELIFVVDSSGSMNGFPIEKSKALMQRALASMRPTDTFNIITFAGATRVLWPKPRTATPESVAEAQAMLSSLRSGGGTEMMSAIHAALAPDRAAGMGVDDLANLPADGRHVEIVVPMTAVHQEGDGLLLRTTTGIAIPLRLSMHLPTVLQPEGVTLRLAGRWNTERGERVLAVETAGFAEPAPMAPLRMVVFLTDGLVANEAGIIDAVRQHARTTRVFSLGIGSSVNRSLIEQVALAGRGESEIVMLADGADAAVDRLVRRLETPVLTDIEVRFEGVTVTDLVTGTPSSSPDLLPDLFEERPLILHGRYSKPGRGAIHIRGRTADGFWETKRPVDLPGRDDIIEVKWTAGAFAPSALPALWARSTVDQVLAPHLAAQQLGATPFDVRRRVVELGERHRIMTPFTSFVAVERSRVVLGGQPMTVAVPIELAEGMQWEGVFGRRPAVIQRLLGTRGNITDRDLVLEDRWITLGSAAATPLPSAPPPPSPASSAEPSGATLPWQRDRAGSTFGDRLERGIVESERAQGSPDRRTVGAPASAPAQPQSPAAGGAAGRGGFGGGGGGGVGIVGGRDARADEQGPARRLYHVADSPVDAVQEALSSNTNTVMLQSAKAVDPDFALGRFFGSEAAPTDVETIGHLVESRHGAVDATAVDAIAERPAATTLDVDMPGDTVVSHPIADLLGALAPEAGSGGERRDRELVTRQLRRLVLGQIAIDVYSDGFEAMPATSAVIRDTTLYSVGDERVHLAAERALALRREHLKVASGEPLPRTAALAKRVDTERGELERLEKRLREIGSRLEPTLFAAIVESVDPGAKVVDRDALRARLGDAVVPQANETLVVSVLLDDRARLGDSVTKAALRDAGLRIVATVEGMPGVVGEITVNALADLAEVEGVRSIGRANPRSASMSDASR